ncbi:unnamed protein product [Parajaminaea phylloscopi]
MFPSIALFSRTTYRGASGSGPGRSGLTASRSSPESRRSLAPLNSVVFKRAQRGLYDGAQIQSGNSIPNSRQKTRRWFKPNVQVKHLRSDLLGETIEVRTTSRALRSMAKKGGLDQYIATMADWRLGRFGVDLRTRMARKLAETSSSSP